jgi:hypothetical protein
MTEASFVWRVALWPNTISRDSPALGGRVSSGVGEGARYFNGRG